MPDRRSMSPESASRAHRMRDPQDLGRYQAIADAAKIKRVEQSLKEAKDLLVGSQEEVKSLEKKIEDLEKEKKAANTKASSLQSQVNQQEEVLRKRKDEHRVIVDRLKNGQKSAQSLAQAAEQALQQEIEGLKKEVKKQRAAKDEADAEIDELKRKISRLQSSHKTELEEKTIKMEQAHKVELAEKDRERDRKIRALTAEFEERTLKMEEDHKAGLAERDRRIRAIKADLEEEY